MTATLTRPKIKFRFKPPKGQYCHLSDRPSDDRILFGRVVWTERMPKTFHGPSHLTLADGTRIPYTWEEFAPRSRYLGSTFLSPGCSLSYDALTGPCCRLYEEVTKHGMSLTPHASEYADWRKVPGLGYVKAGDASLSYIARFFDLGYESVPRFVTKVCKNTHRFRKKT